MRRLNMRMSIGMLAVAVGCLLAVEPRLAGVSAVAYGPRIKIAADGKPFIDQSLRDSEEIGPEQLGNYLSRITFENTPTLAIKPDPANPNRAIVKAKFEMVVADQKEKTVFTLAFSELRLGWPKANGNRWFLTKEGIELIEQAHAAKSKRRGAHP